MKEIIIANLGSNFKATDETILETILEEVSQVALDISNKKTTDGLEFEIIEAVKTLYLRRGTEDVKTLSESGKNSVYEDAIGKMRKDIIANGKRHICN